MSPERDVPEIDRLESCERFVGLLARAADGSIDPPGQARLTAHLDGCLRCTADLEAQWAAREALTAWGRDQAPPGFVANVLSAIDAGETWTDRWDFRRWTWRLAPLATAMALLAAVVVDRTDAALTQMADAAASADVTVAGALASDELSEADILALMLTAGADDPVVEALEEIAQ